MCKDIIIVTKFMQLQVENDLHEDAELRSELRHALDVLLDKHENVQMPSQCNVKSIMTYVEGGGRVGCEIFKSTLVSQLNGNPTLSKDRLIQTKKGYYLNEA
jgi:hypothetical protein